MACRSLRIALKLRNVDSELLGSGDLAMVQFELLSKQKLVFVNPAAQAEEKPSGSVLATADFWGSGQFGVQIEGSELCRRFVEEDVQVEKWLWKLFSCVDGC